MVELLLDFFSFVNAHLDEPVEMVSFPSSIFWLRFWLKIAANFVIYALAS